MLTQVTQATVDSNRKWARPQGLLFADYASKIEQTIQGSKARVWLPHGTEDTDWLTLSDHNRSDLSFDSERIENRRRMVDGSMRSYWTADKYSLSVSWSELPTRSRSPGVVSTSFQVFIPPGCIYTVDGGAGGSEIKHWYDTHPGPFFVLMSFDDYLAVDADNIATQLIVKQRYTHARQMYFSSFSSSVQKRTTNVGTSSNPASPAIKQDYVLEYDTWNVSLSLEEV